MMRGKRLRRGDGGKYDVERVDNDGRLMTMNRAGIV